MGSRLSKTLLASAIGLAVGSQAQAAALRLEVFTDGKPQGAAEVLLNGEQIGTTNTGEKFWHSDLTGGRHHLVLRMGEEEIPYDFSISEDQAALVTVNRASDSGETTHSLQRVDMDQLHQDGGVITGLIESQENLAPGLIQGTVLSKDNQAPLRNVTVSVAGSDVSAVSDRYGKFELELPPGVYQLQLAHSDYRPSQLNRLRVLPQMNLAVDVAMSTADVFAGPGNNTATGGAIEELQVVGRYLPGNPIEIERISSSVVDSIDFTQISRFDDSMVSSALKRVVGVSLEDDRYAVVRGMKSRYQSTDLNGATLPSTDPARRDLPLDIFPAGIMQGLSLQKSATADVPSSATAGHISMKTRDIPEQGFFKFSYSATRGDMHGDDLLMSGTEGDRDWLGMDDGSRELPEELKLTLNKWVDMKSGESGYGGFDEDAIIAMGQSIPHNKIQYGEAPIDSSMSFSGGDSWELGTQRLGVIGALRYANKWSSNTKTNFRYLKTGEGEHERILLSNLSEVQDTNNVIDLSAMLNLQWDINDQHQLGLNNIALRHTTSSAEIDTSYQPPSSDTPLQENDIDAIKRETYERIKSQRVDWIEEQLLSHQLWGEHAIALPSRYLGELSVDWQLMEAATEYDRPNASRYTYRSSHRNSYQIFDGSVGGQYNVWEAMEEDNSGHRVDVELPIEDLYGVSLTFKAGTNALQRDRDGAYQYYTIKGANQLPEEQLENPDPTQVYAPEDFTSLGGDDSGIYLSIGNKLPDDDVGFTGDSYLVEQDFTANYALLEANLYEKLKINLGTRRETFLLEGEQYAYTPEPLTELLDEERNTPSVSFTYLFNDAWQLRAAWSETVSWPEIFEVMPRTFTDIETLERYRGNPELKPADIENMDLRLEWYPSDTESITLALFSKDITNAIENRFDRIGDQFDYYTFDNAGFAEVTGIELDMRREFVLGADRGHELFVQFNYTDITSEVEVTEGSHVFAQQIERPLQGQPEYIANLQLGYDHVDTGQEVTLVFNRKGEELAVAAAGTDVTPANVYRLAYNDLRLIYKKNFLSGLSLSASVDNLLDEEHVLEYENYNTPYLQYASGRRFKLKASYDF
ncbi:TonB-dependent receptor [Microbulbifer sp.]|uniref:TonB-dependent receptor n=1 Tax=Microbulbifer sp. TaxID=1908541 RepID=UPI00258AE326|nr:TonB-dependent receptor [Microbulbifer sp.]